MDIAFYAPLKHPAHPVPSGDRAMARGLIAAIKAAGHSVEVVSALRSFLAAPRPDEMTRVVSEASREIDAIHARWTGGMSRPPDIWFTYHNYYKAPDLLGPALSQRLGLPYVVAEASHAPRRANDWGAWHAAATDASQKADMHICLTERDRAGLAALLREDVPVHEIPPFITGRTLPGLDRTQRTGPTQFVAVAMMRYGDKLDSYRFLADALALLPDLDWHLTLVGDGPARPDVTNAFAAFPAERLTWLGQLSQADVDAALDSADIFVWPGLGEAFGIAYLEAQAAGLPVIALDVAGVSSVVKHQQTGLLVRDRDASLYAGALRGLVLRSDERLRMGQAATEFVRSERTVHRAAEILNEAFRTLTFPQTTPSP